MHEKQFAQTLCEHLGLSPSAYIEKRRWEYFETPLDYLKLFTWSFKEGYGSQNICVARIALPVLLRNLFNKKKVWVVWHYFDPTDKKQTILKIWYSILLFLARWISPQKLQIVCVAPFWKNYFEKKIGINKVLYFPNFFDSKQYIPYRNLPKKKQIHLGQESFKNSRDVIDLSSWLTALGYACYFSTNAPEKAGDFETYEIRYFKTFEAYLSEMAKSEYTLALPYINEGWNRIAHESFLVGTQVIGYKKGGLGDLLDGANGIIVENIEEVLEAIKSKKIKQINQEFLFHFDVEEAKKYLMKKK